VLGGQVATLANEVKEPGTYIVQWDVGGVAGGVYFYRIKAGNLAQARKRLLLQSIPERGRIRMGPQHQGVSEGAFCALFSGLLSS
jgi:hypothetical protein